MVFVCYDVQTTREEVLAVRRYFACKAGWLVYAFSLREQRFIRAYCRQEHLGRVPNFDARGVPDFCA